MRLVFTCAIGWLALAGCMQTTDPTHPPLLAPHALTTEYLTDPVGLDAPAPRLSWKLTATDPQTRNLRQTAYHVLVASTLEHLRHDIGDLWDSGRVASDQSLNIVYNGNPLTTSQRCFWKVRVWDNQASTPSTWSLPSRWIMGVMAPQDWHANWIGANAITRPDYALADAQWIWTGEAPILSQAPKGSRYFRKCFDAPTGAQQAPVLLAVTADDTVEIFINGQLAAKTWGHLNDPHWMRFIDVSSFIQVGRNLIAVTVTNKEQGPTGLLAMLKFANGATVVTDKTWLSSAQATKDWQKNVDPFAHDAWKAATVAGPADCEPWGKIIRRQEVNSPAFEKTFTLKKAVRQATLFITGLGFYEAHLNGQKIGHKVLDPAPTRFDKRVLYSTYDLTEQLKRGPNKLNVIVGHGWYDVRSVAVWNFDNAPWRDFPRMIAQLEIVFEDGSHATIPSDASWQQVASPIGFDCIREGEVIGRFSPRAIDLAKNRVMAEIVPAPAGKLVAAALPPSVVAQTFKPVTIRELKPNTWIVDFGQNMSGWIKLKILGQHANDIITVQYGEKIKKDGCLSMHRTDEHFRYPASFEILPGGWFQTDRFVCDGSDEQIYEPRFTYNGFQYVQISGLKQAPNASTLLACAVHTDFKDVGQFTCSNELINKLQQAILWSYRSNFANGYPTDCPHREKNGWTGDALLASEQAMYNFQNTAAYEKWIFDLMDEQQPNGNLAAIIPTSGWGYDWGNGPAWDSALVIIPWMLYVYQGNTRILEASFDAMTKYVDYMTSRAKDGIVSHGLGDWIPVKTKTPVAVTSTGYYYLDAQIVARTAELLGKTEAAKKYSALAQSIRAAYTQHLYKGNGIYSIGSQTAQSCALHQGLVSALDRSSVEAQLIAAVEKTHAFPDFGILGSKYVFRSLSEAGRTDLAYAMASKDESPSYGNWIKRGATTFWEDWNEGASRNHIMFGDISAWFYQYLGGIRLTDQVSTIAEKIDPKEVAFKTFVIAPDPVAGLNWVKAEHDSPYGKIKSEWRQTPKTFTLKVEIPVNTTAWVYLPVKPDAQNVTAEIPSVASDCNRMAFKLGSGHYTFTIEN